jgi:peptidoglycan/LPS O-acetylase OafA/YrhL
MLRMPLSGSAPAEAMNGATAATGPKSGWDTRLAGKEENSFDAIRLGLATLVIFEHSYFLISNRFDGEPLYRLTGGQYNFGASAVCMFFAISGFLVTRSWVMTENLQRYLAKRVARIVPGFLVATFVACVLLGPFIAGDPAHFLAQQKWLPIAISALALRQVDVIGVLAGNAVNLVHGTLWTIKYEFDCYLLIALIGSLGLLSPRRAWAIYLSLFAGLFAARAGWIQLPVFDHGIAALLISSPDQWPALFPFFFAGSAFYLYRDYIVKTAAVFAGAILLLALSCAMGGMYWALMIGGTYAVIYLALSSSAHLVLFGKRVDLSYGVYLYGWPVGQTLLYFTHQKLSPLPLFALTMAVTLVVAYASWRVVERPSLDILKRQRRTVSFA